MSRNPIGSPALAIMVFSAVVLTTGAVQAYPLKERLTGVTNYSTPMRQALAAGDFDDDGEVEIALTTTGDAPLLVVLERSGQRWRPGRVTPLNSVEKTMRLLTWRENNRTRLVGIELPDDISPEPAMVQIFGGQPFRVVAQFPVINEVRGAALGDSDLDGTTEILLSGWSVTRSYDLDTGNLNWTLPYGSESLVVANVDLDIAPEIIIGGSPTTVIDGVTHAVDWSYAGDYPRFVAAGRIATGGASGFVSAENVSGISVFRGAPWALDWQFPRSSINGLAVADLDGDSIDEIIQADGNYGPVNTIDVVTRQIRGSVSIPGSGIGSLTLANVTGDVRPEILFTRQFFGGSNAAQYVAMRIADGVSHAPIFDLNTDAGGLGAVAIGDVDSDGEIEFILGANETSYGRIRVVDGATGDDEWASPGPITNANSPFYISPRFIYTAQLDADPALEIVVAGHSGSDGRVIVLDGATRQVQLQIGDYETYRPIANRAIIGAELFDYDGDGYNDIVLGAVATSTAASGTRLIVLSLQTGQLLWQSPTMGAAFSGGTGAFVVPGLLPGGQSYLVAATPLGLFAYGSESQLLEWSYAAPVHVATYFGGASGGPEIVFADSAGNVKHLNAATQLEVRSYNLPTPISLVKAMPGEARLLVRSARNLLSLHDNGEVAGVKLLDNLNPYLGSVAIGFDGSEAIVVAGTPYGYVRYENDSDGVFTGGFE